MKIQHEIEFRQTFPHVITFISNLPKSNKMTPLIENRLSNFQFLDLIKGWEVGNNECTKLLLLLNYAIASVTTKVQKSSLSMVNTAIFNTLSSSEYHIVKFIGQLIALNHILEIQNCSLESLVAPCHNGFDHEFIIKQQDLEHSNLVNVINLFFEQNDLADNKKLQRMLNVHPFPYQYKVAKLKLILKPTSILIIWSPSQITQTLHLTLHDLILQNKLSSHTYILSPSTVHIPGKKPLIKIKDLATISYKTK